MNAATLSDAARWVETAVRYVPRRGEFRLTPEQARCIDVISSIDTGPHNLRPILGWGHVNFDYPHSVDIMLQRDLATFDMGELTTLVIRSHQHHVRVEISADAVPAALVIEEPESYVDRDEIARAKLWLRNPERWPFEEGALHPVLRVRLHARAAEGSRQFERHPGLADLVQRIEKVQATEIAEARR